MARQNAREKAIIEYQNRISDTMPEKVFQSIETVETMTTLVTVGIARCFFAACHFFGYEFVMCAL